jgi:hypothetical protein
VMSFSRWTRTRVTSRSIRESARGM